MIDFKGKTALVTGGSRGIGRAIVLGFAKAGANIAFTYEHNKEAAEGVVKEAEALGAKCFARKVEAGNETSYKNLIGEILSTWSGLDVAVANAGIWKEAKIDQMTLEEFDEMMRINMTGSFLLAKYAAKHMKATKRGSIVFISSTAGQRGESEHSHYAASKGAQISFTKSLAPELAPFGVRVNCVAPGWVETDMTKETLTDPAESQKVFQAIPLRRVAKPEEIANAVLFIASPLASFITGEILNVNGGAVLCG